MSLLMIFVFLMSILSISVKAVEPPDAIFFIDTNLKAGLISAGLDTNSDGSITQTELSSKTGKLILTGLEIVDLSGIQYATGINELQLNNNDIVQLSPLSTLNNLKNLDISGNKISNVGPLSTLVNLETLDFSTNDIETVGAIANMTKLINLSMNNNKVFDITPIKDLIKLETLSLLNNKIANVQPLSGLSSLTKLDLQANLVGDISPLNSLTGLLRLDLNSNLVTDISLINNLVNLKFLVLNNNKISNISVIANFTQLEELYLKNNLISDITPLTDLDKIKILDLSFNFITDISALLTLGSLLEVYLSNNSFDFSVGSPARLIIDAFIAKNMEVAFGIVTPSPTPSPKRTPTPTPSPIPIPPVITFNNFNKKLTNKNILVIASTNKGSLYEEEHLFTRNGSFKFQVIYFAQIYEKIVVIKNIDKTLPLIRIKNSVGKIISKNGSARKSATIYATDTNLLKKTVTKNKKAFKWPSKNKLTIKGSYVVTCIDKAGNSSKFAFKII